MNRNMLEKIFAMLASGNDSDAVMALRSLKKSLREEGVSLKEIVEYGLDHLIYIKQKYADTQQVAGTAVVAGIKAGSTTALGLSAMPQCHSPQAGFLEIVPAGRQTGERVALPGVSAGFSHDIAFGLKDAIVAAVINKSQFKLKTVDIKNTRGEVIETALEAQYERSGMIGIQIWVNVKGEVAALASVLRKAVANVMPEIIII